MKILELFSGTHSIGKVAHKLGHEIVSLDRDMGDTHKEYTSPKHFKEDIMTWNYKQYEPSHFDLITASPVCLYWSSLRRSWIGRKCKSIHPTEVITHKHLQDDIDKYGKPMVDKLFEIIDYLKPKYWWIENPQTGRMKHYIAEKYPTKNIFYDVDYCKYSNWGYQKRTRFWTNITNFKPKKCKKDCENIIITEGQKLHKQRMGTTKTVIDNGKIIRCNTKELREKYKDKKTVKTIHAKSFGSKNKSQTCVGGGSSRLDRYRIPEKLIEELFSSINLNAV